MAYCSKCGTQINEGSAFCQNCGAPAPGAAAAPAPAATAPPPAQPVIAPPAGAKNSGLAVGSLVAGIVSFIFNPILLVSLVAIILGAMAKSRLKKDPTLKGKGMSTAGIVLGVISLVVCIIVMAVVGFSVFGLLGI